MSKSKGVWVSESVSQWVSEWVTRSPIELFWTAKNMNTWKSVAEVIFHKDHMVGAVNLPVLSNEQRIQVQFSQITKHNLSFIQNFFSKVGTLYHKDRMAGRKLGAALITANISKVRRLNTKPWKSRGKNHPQHLKQYPQHILEHFTSKAGNYKPLVYCWRGGQRSRSMALILRCPPTTLMITAYRQSILLGRLGFRHQSFKEVTRSTDNWCEKLFRWPISISLANRS